MTKKETDAAETPVGLVLDVESDTREARRLVDQAGLGILSRPIFHAPGRSGAAGDALVTALEDADEARAAYQAAFEESEVGRRRATLALFVVSALLGVAAAVIGVLLWGRG